MTKLVHIYQEIWIDELGDEVPVSETMIINASSIIINEQLIMASTNGSLVPTTLNITRPVVSDELSSRSMV